MDNPFSCGEAFQRRTGARCRETRPKPDALRAPCEHCLTLVSREKKSAAQSFLRVVLAHPTPGIARAKKRFDRMFAVAFSIPIFAVAF
jgi:hypothetical protein